MFGEIGLVSPPNRRTATSIREGDTVGMSITHEGVLQPLFQEPEFGLFLIRLVPARLPGTLEASGTGAAGTA